MYSFCDQRIKVSCNVPMFFILFPAVVDLGFCNVEKLFASKNVVFPFINPRVF